VCLMIIPVIWFLIACADATRLRGNETDVYYVPNLLDKFLQFAEEHEQRAETRHDLEKDRLGAAVLDSNETVGKSLLEKTIEENELSRLETRNVYNEMKNFVHSVKGMMGSVQAKPESCEELTCGNDAICKMMEDGATCECADGFIGDGFICKPPIAFVAKPLLTHNPAGQIADIHTSTLNDRLITVYRDLSSGKGYMLVGQVLPAKVIWSDPVQFSNESAYSPQVVLIPGDRFVISFRDANTEGSGIILGGHFVPATDRAVGVKAVFANAQAFSRLQSHQTSVVPLEGSRFAVFFCQHSGDGQTFGSALLGTISQTGITEQVGIFAFAESAVTRLTATLLSPTSFVVGYRAASDPSADPLTAVREEANAVYGSLTSTDLVFDPHPLVLEPSKTEIWDRGLGLLTANRFMYTYQSGTDEKTWLAVVEVDPHTHRMQTTSKQEIAAGFTPFARSIGLAYAPGAPRTFSFYEHRGLGKFTSCVVTSAGSLTECKESTWLSHPVDSVAGISIGGARVLFVFSGKDGIPYYQLSKLQE